MTLKAESVYRPPVYLVVLCGTLLLLAAGCGNSREGDTGIPGPVGQSQSPSEEDLHDQRSAKLVELSKTEEFKAAAANYETCLAEAGHGALEDGSIPLGDGTVLRADETWIKVTPALAEYYNARDRCEEESGIAALRRANGVANTAPPAAQTSQYNQRVVALVTCMQAKGWRYREPKTTNGLLLPDPIIPQGQQEAFDVDRLACGS